MRKLMLALAAAVAVSCSEVPDTVYIEPSRENPMRIFDGTELGKPLEMNTFTWREWAEGLYTAPFDAIFADARWDAVDIRLSEDRKVEEVALIKKMEWDDRDYEKVLVRNIHLSLSRAYDIEYMSLDKDYSAVYVSDGMVVRACGAGTSQILVVFELRDDTHNKN